MSLSPHPLGPAVYVALGGNEGDVLATFAQVLAEWQRSQEVRCLAASRAYRTRALQRADDRAPMADYWNAVCALRTTLPPRALLHHLKATEVRHGRRQGPRWAARPLDLDLLLYGDLLYAAPELTVPHPQLIRRNFVLRPLCELAAALVVPGTGRTVAEHLEALEAPEAGLLELCVDWRQRASDGRRPAPRSSAKL